MKERPLDDSLLFQDECLDRAAMFDMVSTSSTTFHSQLRSAAFIQCLELMVWVILSYFSEVVNFKNLLYLVVECVAIISFCFFKVKINFSYNQYCH